jgi:hypothetical protein
MISSSRLLLVLGFLSALTAHASPRFTAPVRYDFNQPMTTVTLQAGMIKNDSRENVTGSLKGQLWAGSLPYEGGTIHGHLIATTGRLEALGPAQYFENLKQTVARTPPSVRENYCLVFVLLEYKNGNYVIVALKPFRILMILEDDGLCAGSKRFGLTVEWTRDSSQVIVTTKHDKWDMIVGYPRIT